MNALWTNQSIVSESYTNYYQVLLFSKRLTFNVFLRFVLGNCEILQTKFAQTIDSLDATWYWDIMLTLLLIVTYPNEILHRGRKHSYGGNWVK